MATKIASEADRRFCINCDNKHGCMSGTPPCLGEMMKNNVHRRSGKEYLVERGRVDRCEKCPFFRSCWTMEEYQKTRG